MSLLSVSMKDSFPLTISDQCDQWRRGGVQWRFDVNSKNHHLSHVCSNH